ncbi:MAG TPA: amidohydrolase family protein [Candidatus Polarisedimenticolaceae bacterium]|nr:amidohydrolase family protein [Candidatus Polarisedimenticolaceae bacterium]
MKRSAPAALALASALAGCQPGHPIDLLIHGGWVIDGSGGAGRRADVAIDRGRIVGVGDAGAWRARRMIDATGLAVAPGFVDIHSHADLILLGGREVQQRLLAAKILQGVTTIVVGNCGLGVAPASAEGAPVLAAVNAWMAPDGITAGPLSIGEYLDRLEGSGVVLNVATLVPHGPLRISAMGLGPGAPDPAQLETMRRDLDRSLSEGAFGLSLGLIYPPGMYSATDELIELARVVAHRDGLLTCHIRGSSETLIPATEELLEIARRSGARVHHSHLEAVGERFWPQLPRVLELEEQARSQGLAVSHDVFLYTRAATMMSAIFPPWALEGGLPALLERLRDPATRERVRRDVAERRPQWPPWEPGGWPHNLVEAVGWDGIVVASVKPNGPADLVGRSLASIAAGERRDPFDVVADLMLSQAGQVGQFVEEISGRGAQFDLLRQIYASPAAAVISDAEDYGRGSAHPAHAGAFARTLRLEREARLGPLEQAVRKMTRYPARLVGLDRGWIGPGAPADLVVFDPRTVADRATWEQPRLPAEGVRWVLINGTPVVEEGRYLGGSPGRVLRRSGR